ncbi:MAG: chemotaxis protein CheW [Firmicutes bacterium HGW-Firmicutes-7]|nr:MAG: chemotaxis protein CheW [Firmicutes bacterium HGW-Firmicutes-7]
MDMNNKQLKNAEATQYIVVKIGREQYGINIKYIQNIVRIQNITRVPKAPYYFKGVINLRGEIIPVMSIRLKFGLEVEEDTFNTRIIIVKISGQVIGLIVDEVKEVTEIPEEDIQTVAREANDERGNYIIGVGKVKNELVTLLNLEGFINLNS